MDEDGYARLLDGKKDVIVVSGFRVFPSEVEEVAAAHKGVLEAVAIAAADERDGHVVKLVVVRKDPQLAEADLIAHCKRNLATYKAAENYRVPRRAAAEIERWQDPAARRPRAGEERRHGLRRIIEEMTAGECPGTSSLRPPSVLACVK